jgi:hypothetical protein
MSEQAHAGGRLNDDSGPGLPDGSGIAETEEDGPELPQEGSRAENRPDEPHEEQPHEEQPHEEQPHEEQPHAESPQAKDSREDEPHADAVPAAEPLGGAVGGSGRPPRVEQRTDDERVDAALARLADLDELPLAAQVTVFDDVHRLLQDALTASDAPPAAGAPTR